MTLLYEPERQIEVAEDVDVVVLGGGPAGTAAALASARAGCKTLLVERYGFLGGVATAAMVTNFCGLYGDIDGDITQVVGGIADELLHGLSTRDALLPPRRVKAGAIAQIFDGTALKLVLDELITGGGVRLRFHSLAAGVVMSDRRRIDALIVESKSGRQAVRARIFIDCSGDGDLAAWSGTSWEKGDAAGFLQFPTMMLRIGGVRNGRAMEFAGPRLRELMEAAEKSGRYSFTRKFVSLQPLPREGEWLANATQVSRAGAAVDGTSVTDLSYSEIEGRRHAESFHRFLKECVAGFEDSYIAALAPQIGIRETRRIVGKHVLTGEEVAGGASFDDGIGLGAWPFERHVQNDIEWREVGGPGYYQIPYRCLLPCSIDNLLVAGRCSSATSEAQASLRVMGPCLAMGQAAGTAAALSIEKQVDPGDVGHDELRARLKRDGALFAPARP